MKTSFLVLALASLVAGCAGAQGTGPKAVAQLEPTKGPRLACGIVKRI